MFFSILFMRQTYNLTTGNYTHIDLNLEQNDTVIINSVDTLLTINFVKSQNISIDQYLNDQFYKHYSQKEPIKYIDFGGYQGYIKINSKCKTRLVLDAFVFPFECSSRIITERTHFAFSMSKENKNKYFRIQNDQTFCIWHTSSHKKRVDIDISTEKHQDTFKQMRGRRDMVTMSGKEKQTLKLEGSQDWFKWRSDPDSLSDYVHMNITTDDKEENDHYYLFSVYDNYSISSVVYVNKKAALDQNSAIVQNLYIYIIVSSVVFVILVLTFIAVCIFFQKRKNEEDSMEVDNDDEELLKDYTLCNTGKVLPQPVSCDVFPQ